MGSTKVTFKLEGVDKLARALKKWGEAGFASLERALYREAEQIMAKSKRLCPVDTGALRSTGHVQLPVRTGDKVTVVMGYGGVAGAGEGLTATTSKKVYRSKKTPRLVHAGEYVGYAVWVHENLNAFHPVGQAKYLEEPYVDAIRGMPQRLATAIWQENRTPVP